MACWAGFFFMLVYSFIFFSIKVVDFIKKKLYISLYCPYCLCYLITSLFFWYCVFLALLIIDLLILQVPTLFDKQGAQLLAVGFLVLSRTWISDRIASLNGKFECHFWNMDYVIKLPISLERNKFPQEPR